MIVNVLEFLWVTLPILLQGVLLWLLWPRPFTSASVYMCRSAIMLSSCVTLFYSAYAEPVFNYIQTLGAPL